MAPKEKVSLALLKQYSMSENWFIFPAFYEAISQNEGFNLFVEVGCWKGHSVSYLANCLKKNKAHKDWRIYAVDLWDKLPKANELYQTYPEQIPLLKKIYNYVLEDTGTRGDIFDIQEDSAEGASHFKDGSVDVVFLDASHDEESVYKDLTAWWPKVRSGGFLSGHDFNSPGVNEATRKFFFEKNQLVMSKTSDDIWCVIKRG